MLHQANKLKRELEIIESMIGHHYGKETGNHMRCHEIARITCNILNKLGYDNFEVADGIVLLDEKNTMTHSWIKGSFDQYGPLTIIEAKPSDKQICPNSEGIQRGEVMLIPEWDTRYEKYHELNQADFNKKLEENKATIDFNLVGRYTEGCLRWFLSEKGKRKMKEYIASDGNLLVFLRIALKYSGQAIQ